MARQTRQLLPTTGTSTQTLTLTLDPSSLSSSSTSSQQPQRQQQETLVLELKPKPRKKKVTWTEDTVDNEFMNKKSSKKCCIFHKEKSFDEDASDDEDCGGSPSGDLHKNHNRNCHHSHGHANDAASTSYS